MAWTEITREHYARRGLRYASDCTDVEWALIEPFMPAPSKVGRPRKTDLRDVWNAIQYIAAAGCQWALLPKNFPPFTLETAMQNMEGPVIEIVKRPDGVKGFVVIARRWVVERTFAWLGRCRRLAKDWEASIASSDAWLLIASIRRMTRHIARA